MISGRRVAVGLGMAVVAFVLLITALPVSRDRTDCGSVVRPSGAPTDACEEAVGRRRGLWTVAALGGIVALAAHSLRDEDDGHGGYEPIDMDG